MKKAKSFSNYGAYLERKTDLKTNPQIYNRNIFRAKESPMHFIKKKSLFIQGFDKVTSRQKPSSHQLFNIKDYNNQANYNPKNQMIQTKKIFYPIRRESQPRLNKLIVKEQKYKPTPKQKICSKFNLTQKNQNILTAKDLQNKRKNYHSMDFIKQSQRPNSYIGKHQGRQTITDNFHQQTKISKFSLQKDNPMFKTQSVHSFASYTKRQFLQQKNLTLKRAPPSSGAQSFKIPQQKFKKYYKVISPQKFQKVSKKYLNRYDAINQPWYTKLNYNIKEQLVKQKIPILKMSLQTSRQLNEVHSKYPIRLAT